MWVKNSIVALFFFCSILACGSDKGFDAKMQKLGVNITSNTRAVLQIGDDGCINCNQSMINEFCRFTDDKNVFFLVAVNPNKLDISCFLENKVSNIIFCEKEDFERSQLEFSTKVFLLKNGILDSTVHFDGNNWEEATEYINQVLSKR